MNLQLSYQTQNLPAPHAFSAYLELQSDDNENVTIACQINYLDREDLSEDEIINEGYTLDDDLCWEGELGTNWNLLFSHFSQLVYRSEPTPSAYLHVVLDKIEKGYPKEDQEILMNALIQGIFEAIGKEAPLQIDVAISPAHIRTLVWCFKDRTFTLDQKERIWEQSQPLMASLYEMEFDSDAASDHASENSIQYQNTGEWLHIKDKSLARRVAAQTNHLSG